MYALSTQAQDKDTPWWCTNKSIMCWKCKWKTKWQGWNTQVLWLHLTLVYRQEVLLFPAMKPDDNKTSAPSEGTSVWCLNLWPKLLPRPCENIFSLWSSVKFLQCWSLNDCINVSLLTMIYGVLHFLNYLVIVALSIIFVTEYSITISLLPSVNGLSSSLILWYTLCGGVSVTKCNIIQQINQRSNTLYLSSL